MSNGLDEDRAELEMLAVADPFFAAEEEEREFEKPGMTADEIKSAVQAEIAAAVSIVDGPLAEKRRLARDYYYSRAFGNEVEGKSKVILSDVADTIEWIMPSLMRTFFGGTEFGRYEPTSAKDEIGAAEATAFVNYQLLERGNLFTTCMALFKNACLEGAFGSVYWEEKKYPTYETREALDILQVVMLSEEEGLEILQLTPRAQRAPLIDPVTQQMIGEQEIYDVDVRITRTRGYLCVHAIPPEQFLLAPRQEILDDDTDFCGERMELTKSELVALGFPRAVVENLQSHESMETNSARFDRYQHETGDTQNPDRRDEMQKVWVTRCFVRLDEDGDGIAELREIWCAGESSIEILKDEPADHVIYFDLHPIPMPHTVHGRTVAELVTDLQLIRSWLLRNQMDNIATLNNGRWEVVEDDVEVDDLITTRPGGLVRVRSIGSVARLDTPPIGSAPMELISYLDGVRENRTGMSRAGQGLDASAMRNTTATGVDKIMAAAQARIELVARIFAETGLKRMFRLALREYVANVRQPQEIKPRGTNAWQSMSPSQWNPEMDVAITVGLGTGQATELIQNLTGIIGLQEKLVQGGFGGYMVTPENFYSASSKMVQAMGFRLNTFFTDPTGRPPPPPPPNPLLIDAEAKAKKAEADTQLAMLELKLDAARIKADQEFKRYECEKESMLKVAKIASDERIALAKIRSDARAAAQKAQAKETAT